MSAQAFALCPQAAVRLASGIQDRIDETLAQQGLTRERLLEMPSYLMLPPLLDAGDHVAVIPGQLADAFARNGQFKLLKLSFDLPASVIRMHWHKRFHEDAGNVWLRGVISSNFA